jgi:hypothetical protein
MNSIKCPSCGKPVSVPDELLGTWVRCACQALFVPTRPSQGPAAPPAPAVASPRAPSRAAPTDASLLGKETLTPPSAAVASTKTQTRGGAVPPAKASVLGKETVLGPPPSTRQTLGGRSGAGKAAPRPSYLLALVLLLTPPLAATGFVAWKGLGKPAKAPSDSNLHAGVEIGSTGVKSIVLKVFEDPDLGFDVEPLNDAKTINTALGTALLPSNDFAPDALRDTVRAVVLLYKQARAKYSVPKDQIYIVGSSGLFTALRGNKSLTPEQTAAAVRRNKEALSGAVQKEIGMPVRFIEVEEEATRSFKGIVPRPYVNDAVLIDVGGGNTKGAALEGEWYTTFEVPLGSKTFYRQVSARAKKAGVSFRAEARRQAESDFRPALQGKLARKPALTNRKRVYLSGGAAWALATHTHPENRKAMVRLSHEDVEAYLGMLKKDPKAVTEACLARVTDEKARAKVRKELKRVHDVFKWAKEGEAEQLTAGAEILRGLSEDFDFKNKQVYFARHGLFSWLLSYVAERGAAR